MGYTSKYAHDQMQKATGGGNGEPKTKKRSVAKGVLPEGTGKYKSVKRRSGKTVEKFKGESGKSKRTTKKSGEYREVTKPKGGSREVKKGKRI